MNRCVVNVAIGGYHGTVGNYYPQAQARMLRSLRAAGEYEGEVATWTDELPPGAEPHKVINYHFKCMAMAEAERRGHCTLLWLDAPIVIVKPIARVFDEIEERGYLLWSHPPAGWTIGAWTSDECLKRYNMTRGEAYGAEMICSAVFGYSLDHPLGRQLHDGFVNTHPRTLNGAWHNNNQCVAQDKRVQGHRHDQSVISIWMHRLGLKPQATPDPVAGLPHVTDRTVFVHDPQGKMGW